MQVGISFYRKDAVCNRYFLALVLSEESPLYYRASQYKSVSEYTTINEHIYKVLPKFVFKRYWEIQMQNQYSFHSTFILIWQGIELLLSLSLSPSEMTVASTFLNEEYAELLFKDLFNILQKLEHFRQPISYHTSKYLNSE